MPEKISSEEDIVEALKLEGYAEQFPAPLPGTGGRVNIVVLSNISYTQKALCAAFQAADEYTIRAVLEYSRGILCHNNSLLPHDGAGGYQDTDLLLSYCQTEEENERFPELRKEIRKLFPKREYAACIDD